MRSGNFAQCKTTQAAQNTRYDKEAIDDFVAYVIEQIECLNIPASHVVNIEKTNIDVDMVSGVTSANKGGWG